MDPNLFHIDWERTLEALVGIVVLSFLVERACAILFESRWWISHFEDERVGQLHLSQRKQRTGDAGSKEVPPTEGTPDVTSKVLPGQKYPLKELLAFLLGVTICWMWEFDAVSIIMLTEHTKLVGMVVTAAVVAGGTKGSIALFQGVLGFMSTAAKERQSMRQLDIKRL